MNVKFEVAAGSSRHNACVVDESRRSFFFSNNGLKTVHVVRVEERKSKNAPKPTRRFR